MLSLWNPYETNIKRCLKNAYKEAGIKAKEDTQPDIQMHFPFPF